jgi:recombinase
MIKFGILAGVSSDAQVEDKASIPDQIKTCRGVIQQFGGIEVGCYVMDGYSRTGYDSLPEAMEEIPPLKEAIEAAEQDQYDVLILDNWDRLGDLAQLIYTRYRKYRKQIYSARQSGRLQDPETYDPYADESAGIDMHVQAILQQYRLNKIRRGWSIGIPNRIKKGLVPFRVAYGYTRVDGKTPPVQNPNAKFVMQMKDWFLEGRPLTWIAAQLAQLGAPLPSQKGKYWHAETIRHMLLNPFYAGIVAIGQKRREPSKKGRLYQQRTPQSEWTQAPGGHVPLWDQDTYLSIQNEFARRSGLKNYAKVMYPLAGILRCSECKQKLTRRHISRGGQLVAGLGCRRGDAHVLLEYDRAIQLLADALKKELQELSRNPSTKEEVERRLQRKIADLQEQRALVQQGFQAKIYKADEAGQLIADLEREERTAQTELADLYRLQQTRAELQILRAGMVKLDDLATWFRDEDPAVMNRLLSALCENVWVTPECRFTVDMRE